MPFIAFVVIFLFFTIASGGKMVSAYNLKMLVDQSMVIIIVGCGALFVVAQGSIDCPSASISRCRASSACGRRWSPASRSC